MNAESNSLRIELIFDQDCPNVPQARDVLRRAMSALSLKEEWIEWERSDVSCPSYARSLGSPSILVNGKYVSPTANNDDACCRVYPENIEFKGCPSLENVIEALKHG